MSRWRNCGNLDGSGILETSLAVSCKVKHKFAVIPTNPIIQYLLETMKTSIYTKTSIQRFTDKNWKQSKCYMVVTTELCTFVKTHKTSTLKKVNVSY